MHDVGAVFEGRYEILERLGEGGFGEVYKAAQRTTGQAVALKIMRMPRQGDAARLDKRVARFMREARLCAQLHHPNIVKLIDSGRTEDGLLYTVFSFAPGDTLADVLAKQGALAPREAHHIMLQVLDALVYAHAQGVIHRDLKPSNIMIMPSGARRNALVLDFGIGAMIEGVMGGATDPHTRLTATDETLGTPGYAAPEQLRGLEPSVASDIFAWGLLFIESLTGRPVFTGSSAADIMYQQMGPEPVPLPAALDRHPLGGLLRRATRKNVDERIASARELFEELDRDGYDIMRGLSREALVQDEPFVVGPMGDPFTQRGLWDRESTTGTRQGLASEERRQVTVLCCKVSEPAAAPEEAGERAHLLLEQCAQIAGQHGGYLAAALDNQVLLYFGYPRAHEDDARRAAQAALAIADKWASGDCTEPAPELRMGMHTGVIVTKAFHTLAHGSLALGATPHLAVNTAAMARPGEIALTPAAHQLLRSSFEVLAEDAAESPATRFRLSGERASLGAPTATLDRSATPLIGREHEQGMLLERWTRAKNGAGQCSLLTGEPGIGKSRLVGELRARMVAEPPIFLECICSPTSQNSALHPVIELLRRLVSSQSSGLPAGASGGRRLEALLARHELPLAEAMPLLGALTSIPISGAPDLTTQYAPLALPPHRQKELTFESVFSLLFSMAEEKPVLLLVEDLHWADPSTIELLTKLVHEIPSAPMYAVLTARPEFSPPFPTTGMLQLHLNRLPPEDVRAMMAELLDHKALPQSVVDQVVSRTDGVPLFVEELTRMIVESDALVLRDGGYELIRPLAQQDIPLTLRDLLTARLDDLGRARETAQLAAAIGREFDLDLVRAASTNPDTVSDDVNQLLAKALVQRQRRKGRGGYLFRHALIRDAAYDSLTQGAKQAVHARIANALEASFAELVESRPDLLAYHYAAAEQKEKALGYAQKAAMGALMRSANAEAIGHARTALEWLPAIADDKERAQVEFGLRGALTPALMATQGYGSTEVAASAERSLELIDILGDSAQTAPSLWALTAYHHSVSHRDQARALAQRMVDAAEHERDAGLLPIALTTLGNCLWVDGQLEAARDTLARAITEYQPEKHSQLAMAFGLDARSWAAASLGSVLWALGQPGEAFAKARAGLSWAEELQHANSICLSYLYLATVHYYNGDREGALHSAERMLEHAHRHGLPFYDAFAHTYRGWALREVEQAKTLLDQLQKAGQSLGMTFYPAVVAEAGAALGQVDDALAVVDGCLALAADKHEHYNVAALHRMRGQFTLLRDAGDTDTAAACFERAISAARAQGALMFELAAATAMAHLLDGRGQARAACEFLRPLCVRFAQEEEAATLTEARGLLERLEKSD